MSAIAVIAAMPQEIHDLAQALDAPREERFRHLRILRGGYGAHELLVIESGIGKVNAAIATAHVIAKYQPRAVINTGSAGGLGENVHIGDVVIASHTAHHDVDVRAFGYAVGQVPRLPQRYPADPDLGTAAVIAASHFEGADVHHGLIVSGDQFIDHQDKVARIRADFPDVLAVEMEAAAIAQTCHQLATPCVVIRAISDHADEKADISFDEFVAQAGHQSARMVLALTAALS
ncbi:MAG: 5'-methylthioadenosine/adenosylhomocysteine nucleosidase [Cardiobacteriaceae bacterium]|nr:5'-methylthioadenosine/adenosylhomocysteine nucleosidase [Cardiobacteriaceae bacterium]